METRLLFQAEECVCARERGWAGERVARRWRCWLDAGGGESRTLAGPAASLEGTQPTAGDCACWRQSAALVGSILRATL